MVVGRCIKVERMQDGVIHIRVGSSQHPTNYACSNDNSHCRDTGSNGRSNATRAVGAETAPLLTISKEFVS